MTQGQYPDGYAGTQDLLSEDTRGGGRRRAEKKRRSCLPMLIGIIIFALVIWGLARFVILPGWDRFFATAEDYPGPGTGEVVFVVDPGQDASSMAAELVELDVVASAEAFVEAARLDPEFSKVQAGAYVLREEMKSSDVVDILVDPSNVSTTSVTIPEGFTVDQIVARLADQTGFKAKQFRKVLAQPDSIGLPAYAGGNPEGYLYPATYGFSPADKPVDMLSAMVARYQQALGDNDIEAIGAQLGDGYTPEQIMTVASLAEAEGRGDDMAKIARSIYNRLELPGGGGTNGLLQIDATVLYALGTSDTDELIAPLADLVDSPYNTYRYAGLPPGPIGAPGEQAIQAALNPAEGDWVYWVTVDCDGTTVFSETYEEHLTHDAVNGAEC